MNTPFLFEIDSTFCANKHCVLHVRSGDRNVRGQGNWAVLPNGITVGRGLYDGRYLCDFCGRAKPQIAERAA